MSGKIVDYFENLSKTNKIGHAFLLCNCTLSFIEEELNFAISKYFFDNEFVDIRANEDIILVEPENNTIKKERIQNIHEKMKVTSQLHDKKIYIIDGCEKMNDSAANSLLKLLEEPENNIFAILISSNVDNVMKTIYSRCQILKFYNEDISCKLITTITAEQIDDVFKLLKLLEKKKLHLIANYGFLCKKIKDRDYLRNTFNTVLLIYRDCLNKLLNMKCTYFEDRTDDLKLIVDENTMESIINKLSITSKYLQYIDLNLNTNLLFDRFIIEVAGEENE